MYLTAVITPRAHVQQGSNQFVHLLLSLTPTLLALDMQVSERIVGMIKPSKFHSLQIELTGQDRQKSELFTEKVKGHPD